MAKHIGFTHGFGIPMGFIDQRYVDEVKRQKRGHFLILIQAERFSTSI